MPEIVLWMIYLLSFLAGLALGLVLGHISRRI